MREIQTYNITTEIVRLKSIFFFFQAEDGIRDGHVTGVQTCALPISRCRRSAGGRGRAIVCISRRLLRRMVPVRSEERRVGKECRSRGCTYHANEKRARTMAAATARGIQRRPI